MNKLIKNEELVFIKKGIPFTNSKLIAELETRGFGNELYFKLFD